MTVISSGQTLTGTFTVPEQEDTFTFDASAGESFLISAGGSDLSSPITPKITLRAPDSSIVATGSSFYSTGSAAILYTVPTGVSGTFSVVMEDYHGTNLGGYAIEMVKAPASQSPDSDGDGGELASGQTRLGAISRRGDIDVYTFSANADETFEVVVGDIDASSAYTSRLYVYGPSGTLVATDSEFYNNNSASVSYRVPGGGVYTVIATDYHGTNTGGYFIELAKVPAAHVADSDGNGGAIVSGQTIGGTVNRPGDVDIFTFDASAGDTFHVSVGDADSSSAYTSRLFVYGPDGALINTDSEFYSNNSAEVLHRVAADKGGTYTVFVQDYHGTNTGAYAIELAKSPAAQTVDREGDGGVIFSGQTRFATMHRPGDLDIYTFDAVDGETFEVSVGDVDSTSTYTSRLYVYSPSGALIATDSEFYSNNAAAVLHTVAVSTGGTFTVVVKDYHGNNTGGYFIELAKSPASHATDSDGDGGALSSGQTRIGTMHRPGDLDVYTFDAAVGESFRVSVGDTDATSAYTSRLYIYAADGSFIGTDSEFYNNNSAQVAYRVADGKAGTFTVIVQDYHGNNTGTYAIELAKGSATTHSADSDGDGGSIATGQAKFGTMQRPGDMDIFTITAAAGDAFVVGLGTPDSSSAYTANLIVYSPSGELVGSDSSFYSTGTGLVIHTVAPGAEGVYTVVVQDYHGFNTGIYKLEMVKASTSGVLPTGALKYNTPVIGRINSAGETSDWTFFGHAGRHVTFLVNPGGTPTASYLVPFSPRVGRVNISLIAPDGVTVLGTVDSTSSGAPLALTDTELPVTGTYTLRVTAGTTSPSATGNFLLIAFDITPNIRPLNLNEKVIGSIVSPFVVDKYVFSVAANTQVQFNLASGSTSGLTYSLTGPSGYTGFSNATTSSGLVTLPFAGTYTLAVQGPSGQTGKYGFTMSQTTQISLALNTPYSGTIAGPRQAQLFAIPVTSADPIALVLNGGNAADHNEIYASFGLPPTRETFDYGTSASGASHKVVISSGKPSTLYVLVYNEAISESTSSFTLLAQSAPAVLKSVSPSTGAVSATTTLVLNGAGFNSGSTVELIGTGDAIFPASTSMTDLPTQMTAIFAPGSVPAGTYAVQVRQSDGRTVRLDGALTMVASGESVLSTRVDVPNPVGFHIAATIYVEYSNTGTVAMPAPLLHLTATQGGEEGALLTLDENIRTSGFWTSAIPEGYSQSVQILASGSTPGLLQPGESVRVPVYYAGWLSGKWDFSRPPIVFSLSALRADDATPVDWAGTLATIAPEGISDSAWTAISASLLSKLGSTAGDYVKMLDSTAAYLSRLGETVTDVQDLWNFALLQANNSINPLGPSLTSATDASVVSPGIPLSLGRSFSGSITGRNTLGSFGMGWSTPWDARADVSSDGTVVITRSADVVEIFQPDSRYAGVYFGSPGDYNTLSRDPAGGFFLTSLDGIISKFNTDGTLGYVKDTHGNGITAGYVGGKLISLTHSAGQSLTINRSGDGLIASVTDSIGRATNYNYNGDNQLTSVIDFAGQATTYSYAGAAGATAHALTSITSPGGRSIFYVYDGSGRLTGTHGAGGAIPLTFAYNEGAISTTDVLGNVTVEFFNHHGQLVKSVDAFGNATFARYDSKFNLVQITDAIGLTQDLAYDAYGNVVTYTDAKGNKTSYTYGVHNHLTSTIDARGNRTRYTYNANGDLLSTAYADLSSSSSTYDALGQVTSFLDARGKTTNYAYNAAGQVVSQSFSDGTSYTYSYDSQDRLTSAADSTGTTTFAYDAQGRITRVDYPGSLWLQLDYDAQGRRSKMTDQGGFVSNYQYDSLGRISRLTDSSDALIAAYSYDLAGRLGEVQKGNGTITRYDYDENGTVSQILHLAADGTTVTSRFDYKYNILGELVRETTLDGEWIYTYDAIGQLASADFAPSGALPAQHFEYEYDAVGNRTRTVINGVETLYISNAMNQYKSVGGTSFTYDAAGNLLSDGVHTYTYDGNNHIASIASGGNTVSYTRNALGQIVAENSNGTSSRYLLDPGGIGFAVGKYAIDGTMRSHFVSAAGVTQMVASGESYYYESDANGSISGITSSAGSHVSTYRYDPFGRLLSSTGSISNPFQFIGAWGVLSDLQGTSVMNVRAYDSTTGRFTSRDPLGINSDDINTYRYARNSPVQNVDPSGLFTVNRGVLVAGGIILGAAVIVNFGPALIMGGAAAILQPSVAGAVFVTFAADSAMVVGTRVAVTVAVNAARTAGPAIMTAIRATPGAIASASRSIAAALEAYAGRVSLFGRDFRPIESLMGLLSRIRPGLPGVLTAAKVAYDRFVDDVAAFLERLKDAIIEAVNSMDPNAKTGPSGFGSAGYVDGSGAFPYTVEFENDADASAPAQMVTIVDQLDTDLDWSTFQLTDVGFGDVNISILGGAQSFSTTVPMTYNGVTFNVQITLGINTSIGEVFASFLSIDPDTELPPGALIGFLPPEDGTGRGQGYFRYLVSPMANLSTGTEIRNVAFITFDTNPVIATNQVDAHDASKGTDPAKETLLTIDAGLPTSSVLALPASVGALTFPVSWAGNDDASGIGTYDVYVATNGGAFEPWLTATVSTTAMFTGMPETTYAFYSIAKDNVGHVESIKTAAETQTSIPPVRAVELGGRTKTARYVDGAGVPVTVTFSGPGVAKLNFFGDGSTNETPASIVLEGTTTRSSLSIKSGRNVTTLSQVQINGSLGSFKASTTNFGGVFTVTGTLGSLTLRNISNSIIQVQQGGKSTSYKFGSVSDLSLVSAAAIKSFSALALTETTDGNNSLDAPSIGSMSISGDFDSDLTLTGGGRSLGKSTIGGNLLGGVWAITGRARSISAQSIASAWSADVTEAVEELKVKSSAAGSLDASFVKTLKINGDSSMSINLTGAGNRSMTVGGTITGGTWILAGGLTTFSARTIQPGWSGTFGGSISSFTVKENMSASLTALSIRKLRVSGDLSGSTIHLTGELDLGRNGALNTFTVGGTMLNSQVRALGNINTATVGGMSGSAIFAGVNDAVNTLPSAGDFVSQSTIKTFEHRGKSPFSNSMVAAHSVGSATLRDATTVNGGEAFGVATRSLKSFRWSQPGQSTFRWSNRSTTSMLDDLPDDLVVRIE